MRQQVANDVEIYARSLGDVVSVYWVDEFSAQCLVTDDTSESGTSERLLPIDHITIHDKDGRRIVSRSVVYAILHTMACEQA